MERSRRIGILEILIKAFRIGQTEANKKVGGKITRPMENNDISN